MSSDRSEFESRIAKVRQEVATIAAEIGAAESAAVPKAEALAKLDAWLEQGADEDANSHITRVPAYYFADPSRPLREMPTIDERTFTTLALDVLKPQIRASMAKRIEAHYAELDVGHDATKRPKTIAALREKLFAAECAEERLIVEADAAGIAIPRRPDINPLVLVEVL